MGHLNKPLDDNQNQHECVVVGIEIPKGTHMRHQSQPSPAATRSIWPLLATLGLIPIAAAQAPPGRILQTVNIVNMASKLCVAVAESAPRDGVNVQQEGCGADRAIWDLIDLGGREIAAYNRASGKVLDVSGASQDDGANVQQWTWNGSGAQRWRLENVDGRHVKLLSQNSGKCLDVTNRATNVGANIAQYRCHGGDNQLWQLTSASMTPPASPSPSRPSVIGEAPRPSGNTAGNNAGNSAGGTGGRPSGRTIYAGMIVSRVTSKCVDVERASTADGANIRQWTCNGTAAQLWDFIETARNEVAIVSRASGKVMDVYGAQSTNGANVAQFAWNGGNNQRWRLEQAERGFLKIVSTAGNKCLDLDNSDSADGVNIQQWDCHGRDNQQWRIEVLGSGANWQNYQPGSHTGGGNYTGAPPTFVVGTWRAFNPIYRSNVDLSIFSGGEAQAVIDGNLRVNGYFRDGLLYMGTERFEVFEERNGFRTVQVGQPSNVVRYSRVR